MLGCGELACPGNAISHAYGNWAADKDSRSGRGNSELRIPGDGSLASGVGPEVVKKHHFSPTETRKGQPINVTTGHI